MDPSIDYINVYKSINDKLKRRLFKKPNIPEALEHFDYVSKQLSNEECHEYAALFLLGKARCEAASDNLAGEASTLLACAGHFFTAEQKLVATNSVTFEENLEIGHTCVLRAAKCYEFNGNISLAVNAYNYLANTLRTFHKYSEAVGYYNCIIELLPDSDPLALSVWRNIASCKLELNDHLGCLSSTCTIIDVINKNRNADPINAREYDDMLGLYEVNRVLLVLLNEVPISERHLETSKLSLCTYLSTDSDIVLSNEQLPPPGMSDGLFLALQCLVLASETKDELELEMAVTELQDHLSTDQLDLALLLVEKSVDPKD